MRQSQELLKTQSVPDLFLTNDRDRNWQIRNYFSLWIGSVHNVPSYITVGGFFALGLSVGQIFSVITISSIVIALVLALNGHAGGKYGLPFSVLLKASFGYKGAVLPGVLRGCIAAIMWFGLQTYAGGLAVSILIGEFWPSYLTMGENLDILGLNLSEFISFLIFWALNILFIYGGLNKLKMFTNLLTPLVFIVFGGMAVWAIILAGGISPIISYESKGLEGNSVFVFIACVSSILSTWSAQIVSVSDFTRFARSNKDQIIGQTLGILITFLLFSLASIAIIVGSEIAFGAPIWNVLEVVERFDSSFAIAISVLTICLTTLSVNIVGNIIPAGYQLATLFPKTLNYKNGALVAAILGIMIMPWKLMDTPTSIFTFLNIVGGLLSPVTGIMLAHYFIISKTEINPQELCSSTSNGLRDEINLKAIIVTFVAGSFCLLGQFVSFLRPLYDVSWFSGIIISFVLYMILSKRGSLKDLSHNQVS